MITLLTSGVGSI